MNAESSTAELPLRAGPLASTATETGAVCNSKAAAPNVWLMKLNALAEPNQLRKLAEIVLRVALAGAFLSAVADRFGMWGAPGAVGVAWGDWTHFVSYTAQLNWFMPAAVVPVLALLATIAEFALAVLLLAGGWLRSTAFASGVLLLAFALTMTLALGIKAPLDYSVYTAAAASFYLGATARAKREVHG